MQEFIIGQLFPVALSLSLSGALIGILIAATRPLTGKYFSKKWNYYIWLLVVARLLFPFHFESDFLTPLNFHTGFSQNDSSTQTDNIVQNTDEKQIGNSAQTGSMIQTNDADHSVAITDASASAATDTAADTAPMLPDANAAAAAQHNDYHTATPQSKAHPFAAEPQETKPVGTNLFRTILFSAKLSAAGIWAAAAYIWLIGAITALFIKLFNYQRFQNKLKTNCTRITDHRVLAMENAFCAGLRIKKIPVIYTSPSVASPMTIGLRNPVILIPKMFSDQDAPAFLSTEQNLTHFQLVLHHELIHVARKDLLYKWVYQLLLCIHWFNPILHLIGRQINRDCELACDEAILPKLTETGKQMYGNILLDTAEQNIVHRQNAFATTLLENKKDLKKRLDGILHYKKTTRFRLVFSACVFVMILTLSACSTVWISSDTASSSESEQDNAPRNFFNNVGIGNPSDSREFYDNDEVLAGKDIYDNWEAYNYVRNNDQKLSASRFKLFGSNSFAIIYADRDLDVQITSSFEIPDGKFKIIHVAPDGSVTTLNDTGAKTTQTVTMQKGRNALKMVGQGKKLNNLEIDYSGIRESDFENVFYSEDEEYIYQVKNELVAIDKDKLIDTLYIWDEKDASEIFNTLLTSGTSFTADELSDFFVYSDPALSSEYLMAALRNKTIEPLSTDMISAIMPYLTGDCKTEVLKSLSVEDFYDAFADNIMYLDSSQKDECLMDYLARGGTLTFSMYDEISYLLDKSTRIKLDQFGYVNGDFTTQATIPETIRDIKDTKEIDGIQDTMSIIHESAAILHYEDGSPYIQDILTNHTDQRIIETEYCMLAYDEMGSPLKLRWNFLDSSTESSYENLVRTKADILPDQTENDHGGWSLYDGKRTENLPKDQNGKVSQVAYTLFCLKQVVFENGTVWNNPGYETWFQTYAGNAISVDELQNYYPYQYEID